MFSGVWNVRSTLNFEGLSIRKFCMMWMGGSFKGCQSWLLDSFFQIRADSIQIRQGLGISVTTGDSTIRTWWNLHGRIRLNYAQSYRRNHQNDAWEGRDVKNEYDVQKILHDGERESWRWAPGLQGRIVPGSRLRSKLMLKKTPIDLWQTDMGRSPQLGRDDQSSRRRTRSRRRWRSILACKSCQNRSKLPSICCDYWYVSNVTIFFYYFLLLYYQSCMLYMPFYIIFVD